MERVVEKRDGKFACLFYSYARLLYDTTLSERRLI